MKFPLQNSLEAKLLPETAETARRGLLLLLLLDGELLAGSLPVLFADLVGDQPVLGLLGRALVVLGALLEHGFLDPVDACGSEGRRTRIISSVLSLVSRSTSLLDPPGPALLAGVRRRGRGRGRECGRRGRGRGRGRIRERRGRGRGGQGTFVKRILLLLAFRTAAGNTVELVEQTAHTAGRLLFLLLAVGAATAADEAAKLAEELIVGAVLLRFLLGLAVLSALLGELV